MLHELSRYLFGINADQIAETFQKIGIQQDHPLMVHSSLSTCGPIRGGASVIIAALKQKTGDEALVMPTHTYCYPDEKGTAPIYDRVLTPSKVGAVTNYFRKLEGCVRSLHPTHSIAALGKGSEALCSGHEFCETPCGSGTPYEKLIQRDCSVLMFGVTLNTYTFFHTAEAAAGVPYLYEEKPYALRYRDTSGVKTLNMKRQNMSVPRSFTEKADWLESQRLLKKQKLRKGTLLFIPSAGDVHKRLLNELSKNPFFLIREKDREQVAHSFK